MILISRDKIDFARWDALVSGYGQGLPYAYTWLMDEATDGQWDAIIDEDYKWVLPCPFNRKLAGFKQYYTPYFLQQLGFIGEMELNDEIFSQIKKLINKNCIRARLAFNEANGSSPDRFSTSKTNFVLPLSDNYETLRNNYKKNLQQVLKKKEELAIRIVYNSEMTNFLKFYFRFTFEKFSGIEKISPYYIQSLFTILQYKSLVNVMLAKGSGDNIIAGLLYLKTDKRVIVSLQFANPEYKKYSGPSLLIDALIQKYSGGDHLLDFEGSDIPGIAMFYSSFGPEIRKYGVLKIR